MTETIRAKQYADSVALDDEEAAVRVLYESVLGLWGVVNNLSRLRPVRWKGFRVTIFGSARAEPGTFAHERRSSSWRGTWRRWAARSSLAAGPG
jgi:hypothetical protein